MEVLLLLLLLHPMILWDCSALTWQLPAWVQQVSSQQRQEHRVAQPLVQVEAISLLLLLLQLPLTELPQVLVLMSRG